MILLLGAGVAGVGVGSGLENGLVGSVKNGLAIGLVSSFVVGLGFVLGGGPPQRLGWLQWSRTDTRTNLRTGLVIGLQYGFMVGIGYLLVIVVGGRTSPLRSQLRWSRTSLSSDHGDKRGHQRGGRILSARVEDEGRACGRRRNDQ
jgi:hypothetical protein